MLKINLNKTKVMVSGSKDEVFPSKVDSFAKCGKRVMKNWINIVVFNQLNFKLLEAILPSFRQHRVDLKFRGNS